MKIEKIIFEGYGLGRQSDGRPIFVYKSVPGDDLEINIVEQKKSFAKAKIDKIIEPSEFRIEPKCEYFERCGGCAHQNISYQKQLEYKEGIFKEALERGHIETKINPIVAGSKNAFNYRNKIRFSIITDKNGKIKYGMHHFLFNQGIVELDHCFLMSNLSNEILTKFKEVIDKISTEEKKDFWSIRIREGKATGEIMVEIFTKSNTFPIQKELVDQLKKIEEIKSIYHTISKEGDLRKVNRKLIYGQPIIFEKIGKFTFQISPDSFFQTNSLGAKTLYDLIKEKAKIEMRDRVLDLYCGIGSIGIYLSTLAKKITGVEIDSEAIRDANDNAKINKIHNCEFICQDVRNFLRKNKDEFDILILDPPRSGLDKEEIGIIGKRKFKRIIYVSCNPATFARDIKIFNSSGWNLSEVTPVDMFPQTHHIECVGMLVSDQ